MKILLVLFSLSAAISRGANLLNDPSFENTPSGWTFAGWAPKGLSGHTGMFGAWTGCTQPSCLPVSRMSQPLNLVEGQAYLFSFWYSVTSPSNELFFSIGFSFRDLPPSPVPAVPGRPAPTDFLQYVGSFVALGPSSGTLEVAGWSTAGHFIIDDVVVEPVQLVPEPRVGIAAVAYAVFAGYQVRRRTLRLGR